MAAYLRASLQMSSKDDSLLPAVLHECWSDPRPPVMLFSYHFRPGMKVCLNRFHFTALFHQAAIYVLPCLRQRFLYVESAASGWH